MNTTKTHGTSLVCPTCFNPTWVEFSRGDGKRLARLRRCRKCQQEVYTQEIIINNNEGKTLFASIYNVKEQNYPSRRRKKK